MAEALNLVDDRRPERAREAFDLLDRLERDPTEPSPPRIGLTGTPGAGKSTLLDALVRKCRAEGQSVGIIAVDPSSRRSGGALLGDRVRVRSGVADPGVFFRSMAARDRLGGLADVTRSSVTILSAVFDRIFIETVGVGQSESDITDIADTVVYVAQPGAGDALQFMKAGVLELPHIFVVNKADVGAAAQRTASELGSSLARTDGGSGDWIPPVILVSARDGDGVDELYATLDSHQRHLESTSRLSERRRCGDQAFVLAWLERRYGSYGLDQLGGRGSVVKRLDEGPEFSAFAAIRDLSSEIEDALHRPGAQTRNRVPS